MTDRKPLPETGNPSPARQDQDKQRPSDIPFSGDTHVPLPDNTIDVLDEILPLAARSTQQDFALDPRCQRLMARLRDLSQMQILAQKDITTPLPTQIGQFLILEEIGSGGMGRVYKVKHLKLGKVQALKVMHHHRRQDSQSLDRFHREIGAIGKLAHPNIVSAQHADEIDGVPYLVMDFIDGLSLADILRRNLKAGTELSATEGCRWIYQALMAMEYAHGQGIVHRDLKPGNIMVDACGNVRILDLGLARVAQHIPNSGNAANDSITNGLTFEHQILGTPDFMSPEQIRDSRKADKRTDVYSMGATLYCLLTGKVPYPSPNESSIVDRIDSVLNGTHLSAQTVRSDLPQGLSEIIDRSLAKLPQDRFASAKEFADALLPYCNFPFSRQLLDTSEEVNLPTPSSSRMELALPERGHQRYLLTVVASLLALLMLSGVFIQLRTPDGGFIIVESSDPNADISIVAIHDATEKDFRITPKSDRELRVDVGTYHLHVTGIEANQFELSKDQLVIRDGMREALRVTRRRSEGNALQANKADTRHQTTEPAIRSNPSVADPEGNTAGDTQLTRGIPTQSPFGLLDQPAKLNDIWAWQIDLIREPTQHHTLDTRQYSDVDPQSEWVAWISGDKALFSTLDGEKIVKCFVASAHPGHSVGWRAIRFSPDGNKIALLSELSTIEVRDRKGRLLKKFTTSIDASYLHWASDNSRLVVSGRTEIAVLSTDGIVLNKFEFPPTFSPLCIAVHPQADKIALAGNHGSLRMVDFEGNWQELAALHDIPYFVTWNRTGDQLLVASQPHAWTLIIDDNGQILHKDTTVGYVGGESSPDSEFWVLSDGTIRRASDFLIVKSLLKDLESNEANHSFFPRWNQLEEIDFLSLPGVYGHGCAVTGSLFRFHPSGRRLPTLPFPQSLGPIAATILPDCKIVSYHGSSGLNEQIAVWDQSGELVSLRSTGQGLTQQESVGWNSVDGQITIAQYGAKMNLATYHLNGENLWFQEGDYRNPIWSSNPRRLSAVNYALAAGGAIQVFEANRLIYTTPTSFKYYIMPHAFSSDGRWLAWVEQSDSAESSAYVADVNNPQNSPVKLKLKDTSFLGTMIFSPQSNRLHLQSYSKSNPSHVVSVLYDMSSQKVFEQTVASNNGIFTYPQWSNDGRFLLMGSLFEVNDQYELKQLTGAIQTPYGNRLGIFAGQSVITQPEAFSIPPSVSFTHINDQQLSQYTTSQNFIAASSTKHCSYCDSGNLAICRIENPSQRPIALQTIDASNHSLKWKGLIFDDDQSIVLDSAGNVLSGPKNTDRYLLRTIHYPGGTVIPVTTQELWRRSSASKGEQALQWLRDIGQESNVNTDKNDTPYPSSATEVLSLSLKGHQQLAQSELNFISEFRDLRSLDLSDTPFYEIPTWSTLAKLEQLSLANTSISNLNGILSLPSLRSLSLDRCPLTINALEALCKMRSLESLSIRGCNIDDFWLLELEQLTNLKLLDISECEVSSTAVARIQDKLKNLQVVTNTPSKSPIETQE